MKTRTCTGCGRSLPNVMFYKHNKSYCGFNKRCRDCIEQPPGRKRNTKQRTREDKLVAVKESYQKNLEYYHNKHREYRLRNREKIQAHKAVEKAVRDGLLPRPDSLPCVHCGGQAHEYHHQDYADKLNVIPLCHSDHRLLHKGKIFV